MSIVEKIQQAAVNSLSNLYNQEFNASDFQVNQTKEEFEGDYTIVLFSLLKKTGQNPAALGEQLGNTLLNNYADLFSE